MFKIDESGSIYLQIAQQIEELIFTNVLKEREQVPSTTELSQLLAINPHTILKGMNVLVSEEILVKKRGLGLFVAEGAREKLHKKRKKLFTQKSIKQVVSEAKKLKLTKEELVNSIEEVYDGEN